MKRSKHNLSHHRLASFDMGQLIPVGLVEVLPGDTFRHSSSVLLRIASMANPVMHPLEVRVHHWYVPHRLSYAVAFGASDAHYNQEDTWENFWNSATNANDVKSLALTNVAAGSLANHLGIPAVNGVSIDVNTLPFAAYSLIWNSRYRDQELGTKISGANTTLQRICWEKDYFTSARTYPQYSATSMTIPFSGLTTAPVSGIGVLDADQTAAGGTGTTTSQAANVTFDHTYTSVNDTIRLKGLTADGLLDIKAELGSATGGIDVNDFRRAIALQRFLEARSRYGARYRDYLRYLGVRPSDGRLEEPEYLGGGRQSVAVSEVLATAEGTTTDVGQMFGHGIAAMRTRPYTKFFEEHGHVLSLISVRPKAMYQESMSRHWFRSSRDDFWQKEYEAFGPQAILDKEVYAAHGNETDIFGYQDRFDEYRRMPSQVSGLFSTTDDDWHMAREFGTSQSLNSDFVTCTPTDRIYNDASEPECRVMVNHNLVARRMVAKVAR